MGIPHLIANRFRIEREIGRGGMGTVYRALHLGLERPVAVKVLKPEFAADPEVAERFMREARTMARLRHRGAATIFDAGRLPDGRPFIVMEYVEGATLAETLTKEGRLAPARAVEIACAICDVLAEAHALGIVHRDLKPSNIMLTARGVCLLDFGIAKVLANASDATRTHATTESGLIIGTPRYMSPEQCLGQPVGPASDLYSVGVLLYEMLAGQPPFVDQLQSVVLVKQATAAAPPLFARCQDLPRRLAFAVHTLLAKRPADRPRDAEAARRLLAHSLNAQTQELPAPPAPFSDTLATVNRRAARGQRLVATVVLLAALGGGWLAWAYAARLAPVAGLRAAAMTTEEAPAPNPRTTRAARPTDGRAPDGRARAAQTFAATDPAPDPPALSDAAARQLAVLAARGGTVPEARSIETGRGAAVIALRDERTEGTTHLFLLEPRGAAAGFRVTGRAALDTETFRGAHWTTELVDADGDGYDEVLCTGTDARNDPFSRRLVLYVPQTRESYSLRVGADGRESGAVRVKWSANAGSARAKPYRAAMRERALADLPRVKS
ncbi:MAG TPA: protein kinase [Pyrinomonadaceae bacterium]|jgi:predicted Ser/Thr protein kinase